MRERERENMRRHFCKKIRRGESALRPATSSLVAVAPPLILLDIFLFTITLAATAAGAAEQQPRQLQFDCSSEEDPDGEFLNSKNNFRPCKWLLTDPSHVEEECSSDESISRFGVSVTEADLVCPWSCGWCGSSKERDDAFGDSAGDGIGDALEEALKGGGGKKKDNDEDDEKDKDRPGSALSDAFGLNGNDNIRDDVKDDEDEREAFTEPEPNQPVEQPKQEIKVVDVLDPSGKGSDSDAVISILPRRSRTWQEMHFAPEILNPPDPMQTLQAWPALERDPFFFTSAPSALPSSSPSASPTAQPSVEPTSYPTNFPTPYPTRWPTRYPTPYPTSSTPEPTRNPWRTNPAPSNPPSSYFNYDPSYNAKRGVRNWDSVRNPDEAYYWKKDFGEFIAESLGNNRCDSRSRRQSPIDLRFDEARGQCFEYHQIRAKAGEYSIEDPIVEKQILPSKLRFIYPRNYNPDAKWATENDFIKGPSADIPKGWGHQLPVTHVDIKVPSEHWMEGKQYVAEYQIFLIQNREKKMRGAPAVSVLFDLHPQDKTNRRFQILLDAFQDEYDADLAKCENRRRRQRRLGALLGKQWGDDVSEDQSSWLDEPEEEEEKFQRHLRQAERKAQQYRNFNPWTSDIVRSLWFFGYEGSLTEPPCTEFIEWRILDTPALISKRQLWQLKKIMFGHVDRWCRPTSVHHKGSVSRPLQPYSGRLVHRCMCRDYLGDKDRKVYGMNRCLWAERDQFGFDRDIYTQEWYDKTHKYEDPSDQPLTDWASF